MILDSAKFDLYGLGNAIVDLIIRISEEDFISLGIKRGGMALVDSAEQADLLAKLSSYELLPTSGGSAANTIITAARLGVKTAYGCMVGDDTFGRLYIKEMQTLAVQLGQHLLSAEAGSAARRLEPTGSSVILVTPDAERSMNTHLGASVLLDETQVDETILANSRWVYLEGYLFAAESGRRVAKKALELCKKHGVKLALTFSDSFIVESFYAELEAVAKHCELVFANYSEAKAYVGMQDAEQEDREEVFERFSSKFPIAVMTMSEQGALVAERGSTGQIVSLVPVNKVKAIDDTGAGDAFAGGFFYGLLNGKTVAESAELGNMLASQVVSQLGPRLSGDLSKILGEC